MSRLIRLFLSLCLIVASGFLLYALIRNIPLDEDRLTRAWPVALTAGLFSLIIGAYDLRAFWQSRWRPNSLETGWQLARRGGLGLMVSLACTLAAWSWLALMPAAGREPTHAIAAGVLGVSLSAWPLCAVAFSLGLSASQ